MAALLTCLSTSRANAATSTATFTVTASAVTNCTIEASALDFGTYIGDQVDGQSTITVSCTNGTPWEVGLNAGSSLGATVNTRRMTGPGLSALSYDLFTDPARTEIWGFRPLLPGQEIVSGTGTGGAQVLTVYGRIPAGDRTANPGSYTDTITATVTF